MTDDGEMLIGKKSALEYFVACAYRGHGRPVGAGCRDAKIGVNGGSFVTTLLQKLRAEGLAAFGHEPKSSHLPQGSYA